MRGVASVRGRGRGGGRTSSRNVSVGRNAAMSYATPIGFGSGTEGIRVL